MEEVYRFPQRANGKTVEKTSGNAIHHIVPDLDSHFRGNDGKRDCVYTPT
jgi:hypothetical protein